MADENSNAGNQYYIDGITNSESNSESIIDTEFNTVAELVITGTAIDVVEYTCDGNRCEATTPGACDVTDVTDGTDCCVETADCSNIVTDGCCGADCGVDDSGNCGKACGACNTSSKCCDRNNMPLDEVESGDDATNAIVPVSPSVSSESSTEKVVELAQPLFKRLVVEVKERMTGSSISSTTVTIILKYAMEVVELSEVKGAEQKELALDIVRQIIVDAPLSPTAESACMLIVNSGVLVGVVDLVVDASKGRLSVNQVKKRGRLCLRGLGCMKA